MRRRRYAIEDLRRAIDCLPVDTRVAMLHGVKGNDIIVGAYTTRDGGVCPMLAAHRCGGRTSLVSFAHTWDRFTMAKRARRATERELRILVAHLESSLLAEGLPELQQVIVAHRAGMERNAAEHGTFRRRLRGGDVYERALAIVEAERDRLAAEAADREAAREPELV
ncbi:MAG: hypothetical protein QOE65_1731 [Solirubrobacteraceae bacterium]|jgi:hypothetical protein|nr:hypothetical protein [Solirubrobacteraceae bacterium]